MPAFLQNNQSIAIDTELRTTTCWCGIHLAIPANLYRWARESDRHSVYCPLGHTFVFTESNAEKLAAAEARQRHLEDQLQASAREAEATRVALLRDRQRFANGVCPCCNRSFENVARHMKTEHPGYDVTKVEDHGARTIRFRCSCGASFETLRGLRTHQGHMRTDGWEKPDAARWRSHLTVV